MKESRLAALHQLLNAQQVAFNHSFIGRSVPVLFDRVGRRDGQLLGRSPWMQSVHAEANERLLGRIVEVRVDAALANSLAGTVVTGEYITASPFQPAVTLEASA